jgi:putative lipoic acid-binding regulatory protein
MNEFLTDKDLAEQQHTEAVQVEEAELERETLIEFPCQFPIKIMGPATDAFMADLRAVVAVHASGLPESAWKIRASAQGNFVGMTVTIEAISQSQLDAIYRGITAHPDVKMCL